MDMLRWQVTSRDEFERLRLAEPDSLTDLERAARFLYLQRAGFGGRVRSPSFGVSPKTSGRFDVVKLGPILEQVHERLSGVVIERKPYAELLPLYDRPDTLFYLDPPYFGCERDYGDGIFGREDFQRLAVLLAGLRGRFILSMNDTPEVRGIFAGFALEEVETTWGVNRDRAKRVPELLITRQPSG